MGTLSQPAPSERRSRSTETDPPPSLELVREQNIAPGTVWKSDTGRTYILMAAKPARWYEKRARTPRASKADKAVAKSA